MAQTVPVLSLAELVKAMGGSPCTQKWDIVCSYSVEKLNDFLKAQYDAGKLAKIVEINFDTELPFLGKTNIAMHLEFDSPRLLFLQNSPGFGKLIMPINNGTYLITPDDKQFPPKKGSITPEKYRLMATIPIKGLKGDTLIPQGQVIVFEEKGETGHIVLHFTNEEGTEYKFDPEPEGESDIYLKTALVELVLFFQSKINEFAYALASVNNTPPSAGLSVFTPQSFVFASVGDGDCGALSIYIQTAESGNPQGNPCPSFVPGYQTTSPIPTGYTASIILSYDLITKSFLKPQLEKCGFNVSFKNVMDEKSSVIKDGIYAGLVLISGTKDLVFQKTHKRYMDCGLWYEWSVDGCTMKMEPLDFSIQDGLAKVDWTDHNDRLHWDYTVDDPESPAHNYLEGKVTIKAEVHKNSILKAVGETTVLADMDVSKEDITISLTESTEWWTTVPDLYLNNLKFPSSFPTLHVDMHGFDFFRTTNLLAPGKHMIEVDPGAGVSTPRDFLIVGQVVKQKES